MKRKFSSSSSSTSIFNLHNNQDQDQNHQQDRLSSLPDVLLIYILSFIDTKLAVQASILSKRWVNLWTLLPVLNFDSSLFDSYDFNDFSSSRFNVTFDMFIDKVLANRNALIKLDGVNIRVTDCKTLARVFDYAVMQHVVSLSVDSSDYLTKYRPIECGKASEFLSRLSLKGMMDFGRFPRFSGLVSLRLERVRIVDSEPFSCFPNLKELFLVNCKMVGCVGTLEVIGYELLRLTISSCFYHPIPYEKVVVLAPKLVVLELDGLIPMVFEAFELPVLETVHIDCCFSFPRVFDRNAVQQPDEEQQKVNLIRILWCVRNAKFIHLSPSTVKLLTASYERLVEEPCPFVNLKVLNLIPPPNKPVGELHPSVKTYLLRGSPRVEVKSLPR